mmetsp:Transcript_100100/g.321025  ORF Transcript_100100/g.321025 Transcript_100100/m.321025 type:complete len:372 (-) Transcript_100100:762-1877(-)
MLPFTKRGVTLFGLLLFWRSRSLLLPLRVLRSEFVGLLLFRPWPMLVRRLAAGLPASAVGLPDPAAGARRGRGPRVAAAASAASAGAAARKAAATVAAEGVAALEAQLPREGRAVSRVMHLWRRRWSVASVPLQLSHGGPAVAKGAAAAGVVLGRGDKSSLQVHRPKSLLISLVEHVLESEGGCLIQLKGSGERPGLGLKVVPLVNTDSSGASSTDVDVHEEEGRPAARPRSVLVGARKRLLTHPPQPFVVLACRDAPPSLVQRLLLPLRPAHPGDRPLEVARLRRYSRGDAPALWQQLGLKGALPHGLALSELSDLGLELRGLAGGEDGLVVQQVTPRRRRVALRATAAAAASSSRGAAAARRTGRRSEV